MRTPTVRAFLGRHSTATQAGLALVAAAGLAWSNVGLALADLSLPESLPVTCASGSVGDLSAVQGLSPIADLSAIGDLSAVTDCSPVVEVSPVSPVTDDSDSTDDGDDSGASGGHSCQFDRDKDLGDDRGRSQDDDKGKSSSDDKGKSSDDKGGDDNGRGRGGRN